MVMQILYTKHFDNMCQNRRFIRGAIEKYIFESVDAFPEKGKIYIIKRLELNGKENNPLPFLIIVGEIKNYKNKLFKAITLFNTSRLDVVEKLKKNKHKIIFI